MDRIEKKGEGVPPADAAGPATARPVLAQVLVCSGCCCGRTEKGKPPVPVDWLKRSWKERKLHKSVHLSVTGCLGPCDLVNVAGILTADGQRWFGGVSGEAPYAALLEWAEATREFGRPAPVPRELLRCEFDRFRLQG